ncbi:ergothioneine biosynthesis protein 1-like isoform X1 [Gigantopelta aegis]|uniref:ergothioneine biosynthesis protein 1-like isoform X1 n=2 Tax=Gigantopelta aegis TaxID=1735272 RepID=UPI001B8897F2|nr:ergothioneine biosynthesis protein 1-like isoform X1 [Gigantopelta aegis]
MLTKVLTGQLTFTSLKPLDLSRCTKQQLQDYFINTYDLYESLFTSLKDETAFYKCPNRLRLSLIFYFAHTAAVYVNKLMLAGMLKERINLQFETMFETGVDEMSWDDTENYRMGGSYKWPSVDDVVAYRYSVRNMILKVIKDTPLDLPVTMESSWWALLMGMEHERIHLETSSVLIRQLPVDMVTKPDGWVYGPVKCGEPVKDNPLVRVKGQEVTIGKPDSFPSYGWDNEYGELKCVVPPFEASKYLVTNHQFLKFVKDGGYLKKEFWSKEGWQWLQLRQAKHPTFWICFEGCKSGCGYDLSTYSHCQLPSHDIVGKQEESGFQNGSSSQMQYMYRAMFDVIALPMNWPVECNYHEAKAFCCWLGADYRLPGEAEHHVMRGLQDSERLETSSDIIYNDKIEASLNFQYGSSTPVNMYPATEAGFCDVFGNVWEWVEDHFNGLPGFRSNRFYDDYSTPSFDGQHNIILGGSWISNGDVASRFVRFAFRRHFLQHCGFRVARSLADNEPTKLPIRLIISEVFVVGFGVQDVPEFIDENKCDLIRVPSTNTQFAYDIRTALEGILDLEFGYRDGFANVVVNLCNSYTRFFKTGTSSVVHLGSGTGRAAFELSKVFSKVLGVEYSGRFVDTALKIQKKRSLSFVCDNGESREITLDDSCNPESIVFKQLTWIPNEVASHDLTLITNMNRLLNPTAWLLRLWEITQPDGIAVVASDDCTWHCQKLQPILSNRLKCMSTQEVPFQGPAGEKVAMVTVWKRI